MRTLGHYQTFHFELCGSRKYPYPTTEGIGNSGGVGGGGSKAQEILERLGVGGQRPRKFWRGGGLSVKLRFQMVKFDAVTTQFKNRFLSTLQTFYIESILPQVFDTQSFYILNRFSF